jgi:hypothetical protein
MGTGRGVWNVEKLSRVLGSWETGTGTDCMRDLLELVYKDKGALCYLLARLIRRHDIVNVRESVCMEQTVVKERVE